MFQKHNKKKCRYTKCNNYYFQKSERWIGTGSLVSWLASVKEARLTATMCHRISTKGERNTITHNFCLVNSSEKQVKISKRSSLFSPLFSSSYYMRRKHLRTKPRAGSVRMHKSSASNRVQQKNKLTNYGFLQIRWHRRQSILSSAGYSC
jgi:hypothetical protein